MPLEKEPDFPRAISKRELRWIDYLLPQDRPGYAALRRAIEGYLVLGEGRWGEGDLMLGDPAGEIDPTEGVRPVVAYGEISGRLADGAPVTISLALHQPYEEGLVEFQIANLDGAPVPEEFTELSQWSFSYWSPGDPCPATGQPVREIPLNDRDLTLVLSPARRVLWLFDALSRTSTLIPVTNFYNELMLLKGVKDPKIALDHRLLFGDGKGGDKGSTGISYSDEELAAAFVRYNSGFRKVDPERLARRSDPERGGERSVLKKLIGGFRRSNANGNGRG
jgi:hypothetical protein